MSKFFYFLFLLSFLVSCSVVTPKTEDVSSEKESDSASQIPDISERKLLCNSDEECVCGGIDTTTGDCFIGTHTYAAKHVDFSKDCPDFCTGIAGHLETKCVNNKCANVQRQKEIESSPVACTMDAMICPDGSAVGREGPNCEFAQCPVQTAEDAHWLCDDGSWKNNPAQCYENTCLDQSDCQMMHVKDSCELPFVIPAPKTVRKVPVFYEHKCGAERCILPEIDCSKRTAELVKNADCVNQECVLVK